MHIISKDEINNTDTIVQIEEWNDAGDTFWCALMETYNTLAYISIDTKTWGTVKYGNLDFYSDEYVLNPNTGWVVYSDYPVMFDITSAEQYMESKQMTTLSIYNLITQDKRDIDTYMTMNLYII